MFTLTFTDTIITNNSTTSSSYAGAYIGNVGKLTMTGCTIEENSAIGNYGGMYIGCAANATTTASITISNTDFLNNSATSYAGLGVGYGTATISDCTFSGNTAQTYAVALLLNLTESGTMVKDTTIENNTSTVSGYMEDVYSSFVLATADDGSTVGQLYDNAATLGQDVYAAYGTSANTVLQLIAASTMLTNSADEKTGIGWLDEARDTVTTTDISYNSVKKYYPLTLEYETSMTVAVIRKIAAVNIIVSIMMLFCRQ